MVSGKKRPSLIAIVGPTASGKSDLAMKIAKEFNGEIICADSRTIYKGMDIGTAKPSAREQKLVKHWGLDLVEPGEKFSAGKFKTCAEGAIKNIQGRDKLPILVGGTGLYVDGVLYDFSFVAGTKRRWFNSLRSSKSLQKTIQKRGLEMPENVQNRRHLLRTIERAGQVGSRQKNLPPNALLLGLLPSDQVLRQRIEKRAQQMFKSGIIAETEGLLKHYGDKAVLSTSGIIYQIVADLLRSKINKSVALEQFISKDWQYARRQKTWFRRNPDIKWFSAPEDAYKFVKKRLLNT